MSIAALQAETFTLTELTSTYTTRMNMIDARVMKLTYESGWLTEQSMKYWQQKWNASQKTTDDEDTEAIDTVDTYNSDEFQATLTIQQNNLQAQNKLYETEKNQLQTQLNACTTRLESIQKSISKCIEDGYKTF